MYDAALVYPVPDEKDQPGSGLGPGPEMDGAVKPVRDGRYLRYFEDRDDWAWTEFSDGQWRIDGFFPSDIQDAPWRGAIKLTTPPDGAKGER